ncbi:MAG: HAD-IA family hydrolase [Pseudonocardiaceae bacterium]|nr:HAD-IA family hydrolase [Pseudonocardiaceae bacterium]
MPEAVLFDFNGTLSNDEPVLLRIFTELFEEYLGWRMTAEEYFARLAGRSDEEIVRIAVQERAGDAPDTVRKLLKQRRERYRALVAGHPTITPATLELVRGISSRGIPLGIVTGAARADVTYVLSNQDIAELFTSVVCAEDVVEGKPDPEGFLRAAGELNVSPQQTVVFEDSIPGLRAARAAGMIRIGVVGTLPAGKLEPEADAVLENLDSSAWRLLG